MDSPFVFISYSRHDLQFALRLVNDLTRSAIKVWIDKINIPPGARWDQEIEKALDSAGMIIVILSPHSVVSNNVRDEISYALQAGIKLIPVYSAACRIPLRIHSLEYVDFIEDYGQGYHILLDELQRESSNHQQNPRLPYAAYKKERKTISRNFVRNVIPAALAILAVLPGVGVLTANPVLPIENHLDKIAFLIVSEVGSVLLLSLIWYNKHYLFSLGKTTLNKLAIISFEAFLVSLTAYLFLYNAYIVEVPDYDPVLLPVYENGHLRDYITRFGGSPEALILNHGRDTLAEAIQLYSKQALFFTVLIFCLMYNLIYLPVVFTLNLIYLKVVED